MLVTVKQNTFNRIVYNIETNKFHEPTVYDLSKSVPFEIRTSHFSATTLKDFKNETITRCKNEQFTWFFCFDEADVIPYLVCEDKAWVVFDKVLNTKPKQQFKLFDNDKLVYENSSGAIIEDLTVQKDKIFLL